MLRLLISLLLFLTPPLVLGQAQGPIELRTPDGRTVILKSDGTWEYKKDSPRPAPTPPGLAVLNTANATLPANYAGHDPTKLLVTLVDLRKRLVKSEFETTVDHAKRAAGEKKQPILNDMTVQDTFHLVASGVEADYDADSQTMRLGLPVEKNNFAETYRRLGMKQDKMEVSDFSMVSLYKISLGGYRGHDVFFDDLGTLALSKESYKLMFSTSVNMSVDEARRVKNSAKALLVVQFEEPYAANRYSDEGQFQVRLLDVQFFDQQTGKILAKTGK